MDDKLLILASESPRRKAILESLGVEFEIVPPAGVDEEMLLGGGLVARTKIETEEKLIERVERLALLKAYSVAQTHASRLVLGADTIVAIDSVVLGKPRDEEAAAEMLGMLSGKTHYVYTSLALVNIADGIEIAGTEKTAVTFNELSDEKIGRYIERDQPFDKAGGYAIQGIGSLLVRRVNGCYFNVVGLPVSLLEKMLTDVGRAIL
ncbi:septum formation protein Maf [bacterium]|nr:septum formation protein Maf [bacterium]